jgi:hypothetical protein
VNEIEERNGVEKGRARDLRFENMDRAYVKC